MREIRLIFPILFKSMFRKREGEKSSSSNLVAYIVIGVVFGGYSLLGAFGLIPTFIELKSANLIGSFLAFIFTITSFANLFFAIMPMVSSLYFSNDSEYYLSLPVKPQSVFVSKILLVYASQTYIAGIISLPMILVMGIALALPVYFYFFALLGLFITPLLAIMLASIIAAPIMYLARVIKSKTAVTSIFAVLAFTLLLGGYMYMMLQVTNGETDLAQVSAVVLTTAKSVGEIMIPFTAIGNLATLSNVTIFGTFDVIIAFLLNLAVVIVFFGVVIYLCFLASARFYKSGVAYMLEHRSDSKKENKARKSHKQGFAKRSPMRALLKAEILSLVRNTAFAFNCLGCLIMIPMFSAFMSYVMKEAIAEMGADFAYGIIFCMMCGMTMSMNVGACSSFSREGERFIILKLAPIDRRQLIKMKLAFYSVLLIITFAIALVISVIIINVSPLHLLSLIPSTMVMIGVTAMDILWEIRKPNLSWVNPIDAVKNGSNVLVPTFICIGFMLAFIVVFVVGIVLLPAYALLLTYGIIGVMGLIMTLIFTKKLYAKCNEYIERVEI